MEEIRSPEEYNILSIATPSGLNPDYISNRNILQENNEMNSENHDVMKDNPIPKNEIDENRIDLESNLGSEDFGERIKEYNKRETVENNAFDYPKGTMYDTEESEQYIIFQLPTSSRNEKNFQIWQGIPINLPGSINKTLIPLNLNEARKNEQISRQKILNKIEKVNMDIFFIYKDETKNSKNSFRNEVTFIEERIELPKAKVKKKEKPRSLKDSIEDLQLSVRRRKTYKENSQRNCKLKEKEFQLCNSKQNIPEKDEDGSSNESKQLMYNFKTLYKVKDNLLISINFLLIFYTDFSNHFKYLGNIKSMIRDKNFLEILIESGNLDNYYSRFKKVNDKLLLYIIQKT